MGQEHLAFFYSITQENGGLEIIQNRVFTNDHLQHLKVILCSRCYLCRSSIGTSKHLFLECHVASSLRSWILSMFRVHVPPDVSLHDFFLNAQLICFTFSSNLLWYLVVCNLLWCLWFERNQRKNEDSHCCTNKFKKFFLLKLKDFVNIAFSRSSSRVSIFAYFCFPGLVCLEASCFPLHSYCLGASSALLG